MSEQQEWAADTSPRREGCPVVALLNAVRTISERYPDARLVRNRVGNLAVMSSWLDEQVGTLDLTLGQFIDYGVEDGEEWRP